MALYTPCVYWKNIECILWISPKYTRNIQAVDIVRILCIYPQYLHHIQAENIMNILTISPKYSHNIHMPDTLNIHWVYIVRLLESQTKNTCHKRQKKNCYIELRLNMWQPWGVQSSLQIEHAATMRHAILTLDWICGNHVACNPHLKHVWLLHA